MNVLVTGAEGFIGGYLIKHLKRYKTYNVIGTAKTSEERRKIKNICDKSYVCDMTKYNDVAKAVIYSEPDVIFHLAAQSYPTVSYTNPDYTIDVNVNGTVNLFEAIKISEIPKPRVVVTCSSAQYGSTSSMMNGLTEEHTQRPLHIYGVSKQAQESIARTYSLLSGMDVVILRLFNTTGAGKAHDAVSDFAKRIVACEQNKTKYVEHGNLNCFRDISDVNDVVAALERCVGIKPDVYNLCSGTGYSMKKILNQMCRMSIRNWKADSIPLKLNKDLYRPIDEKYIIGDNSKFVRASGWCPRVPIKQTLTDVLEYERSVDYKKFKADIFKAIDQCTKKTYKK